MRLADDIALLARADKIARRAIYPDAANERVPVSTFDALTDELKARHGSPADYTLIGDEALWLIQAAKNLTLYRLDDNAPMAQRWRDLAEKLVAAVALDLQQRKAKPGGDGMSTTSSASMARRRLNGAEIATLRRLASARERSPMRGGAAHRRFIVSLWRWGLVLVWFRQAPEASLQGPYFTLSAAGQALADKFSRRRSA